MESSSKEFNVSFQEKKIPTIIEIDRDLHSNNIGEQCKAILLSGKIINDNKTDIVIINTILLKLADHFRTRYSQFFKIIILFIIIFLNNSLIYFIIFNK